MWCPECVCERFSKGFEAEGGMCCWLNCGYQLFYEGIKLISACDYVKWVSKASVYWLLSVWEIFYSYYVLCCIECCYLVGKLNVFGSEKVCVSNTSKLYMVGFVSGLTNVWSGKPFVIVCPLFYESAFLIVGVDDWNISQTLQMYKGIENLR